MAHITLSVEQIEATRIKMAVLQGRRGLTDAIVGKLTGYSRHAIQKWRTGREPSSAVTLAVIRTFPELGVTVACPCCGRDVAK